MQQAIDHISNSDASSAQHALITSLQHERSNTVQQSTIQLLHTIITKANEKQRGQIVSSIDKQQLTELLKKLAAANLNTDYKAQITDLQHAIDEIR